MTALTYEITIPDRDYEVINKKYREKLHEITLAENKDIEDIKSMFKNKDEDMKKELANLYPKYGELRDDIIKQYQNEYKKLRSIITIGAKYKNFHEFIKDVISYADVYGIELIIPPIQLTAGASQYIHLMYQYDCIGIIKMNYKIEPDYTEDVYNSTIKLIDDIAKEKSIIKNSPEKMAMQEKDFIEYVQRVTNNVT